VPMRRTIGISLAFLVISAGAIAKASENNASDHPAQPHRVKPGEADLPIAKTRSLSCKTAHARSAAAQHRGQKQYAASQSVSQAGGGPPDVYVGPVHPVGRSEIGTAAWYNWVGGRTSSGEILDTVTPTAAHRSLPLASYAKVTNLDSGRSIVVRINDRGPWTRRFIIDLSPRAADELDMRRAGVAAVIVEPVVIGPAPPNGAAPTVAAFQTAPAAVQ
jgi:rare lipoprotein A (peptidoglycan hydrolase)